MCAVAERKKKKVRTHACVKNYEGSSKGMESAAILEMAVNAPKQGFVLAVIVFDDDSTMRAHLQYPHVGDKKGKLPLWIYSPEFLADPSHQKKVVAKHFYALASAPVSSSRVTNDHAKRMKKNWGYMLQLNTQTPMNTFVEKSKAPLEHMFNNHKYCTVEWCQALQAQKEGKAFTHPQGWLSVEEARGKKIYDQLQKITSKYGSEFYLKQSAHSFNTQTNEALNESQALLTPKAKVFHESMAFHYRHAIVVGCHNWGFKRFWTEYYSAIGLPCSPNFLYFLQRTEKKRKRYKDRSEKAEVKRRRAHKQDATEKKLLYESRTSEYGSGIGLDIGAPATRNTPKKTRAKRTECPRCFSKTHFSSNSRECWFNKKNVEAAKKSQQEEKLMM